MASALTRSFHVRFLSLGIFEITRFAGKPSTLGEMTTAIRENIREIGGETLVKMEANFRKRLQIYARENKHHLSVIIFCS